MSRLKQIQRRLAWNARAEHCSCSAIKCPDSKSNEEAFFTSWNCNNCMLVTKERFDNWMRKIDKCLA